MTASTAPRRRTKGTGSVSRLPDGRFLARYGTKSAVARTEREAERFCAELKAGTYTPQRTRTKPAPDENEPSVTLAEFIPRWLEYCRSRDVSEESIRGSYAPALERIAKWIGHVDLRRLTPEAVAVGFARMAETPPYTDGRRYSTATIRMSRAVLRRCLTTAKEWKYITENPVTLKAPKDRPRPLRRISFERAIAIRDAVQGTRAHGPVVLGLYYGMRIGEVLGLRWQDIEDGFITVRGQTLATQQYKARTKGGREREIPVIPQVEAVLRAQRVQQAADELVARRYERSGFIFTGPSGRPLSRAYVRLMLHERLPAAGLERATFHSLRHMTATLLSRCGVPEDVRRAILGHESAEVHRGYVEIGRDDVRVALERLSERLG